MGKKKLKSIALCCVLCIVILCIGIFAGMQIAKAAQTGNVISADSAEKSDADTASSEQSSAYTDDDQQETGSADETQSGDAKNITEETGDTDENVSAVLYVNGSSVTLGEVRYYLYQQRDYFVNLYGEEPWEILLSDGQTVADYAKEQLYADIVETQLLVQQASNYDVSMTDDMLASLADAAQEYVETLGTEICEQFDLSASSIAQVYEDTELAAAVEEAIMEALLVQLQEDESSEGLTDEELAEAAADAYVQLYAQWEEQAEVVTTELWESLVVGSVG